ncbi:MAG: sugar phosphate isomerase/epimerase [Kosmotoga sp.]|jgi:sugar phosphate isomerase/epimerase|nr:MAG: sugar phosphate isomerase/epimerase [Kosmotoga sp.]
MKLGIFTPVFSGINFEEMLKIVKELNIKYLEMAAGGYPGNIHCDPEKLLSSERSLEKWEGLLDHYKIEIGAISAHGNPLHPNKRKSSHFRKHWRNAVLLAEKLGVRTVVGFSGCPGDSLKSKFPNWVTCSWPEDYQEILKWQWENEVIPYWKEEVGFAKKHGIKRIAIEMHPGFVVYNPETLFKLRHEVGDIIGVNFDPSHLFWQQVDILRALRSFVDCDCLYHFHAKDISFNQEKCSLNGVLETKPARDIKNRSWNFKTVGYGHKKSFWKKIIKELQIAKYQGMVSIEHEDRSFSALDGLKRAVDVLKEACE